MKAAVLQALGQPLEVRDVPKPEIGPEEVLVATKTCGICRTDIHIQDGLAYVPEMPHVPGHEPAGVVAEVGERVEGIEVGQAVTPHLFLTCGRCLYCRTGRDAQCTDVGGIIGVTTGGGFAEYFKAPAMNLLTIPKGAPFDAAGLVSCAVITAVHAYRRSRLEVGETAVVMGAGGIGLMLIQILKHAGLQVVTVNRSDAGLKMAKEAGADLCVRFDEENAAKEVLDFTGSLGATAIYECVGRSSTMKVSADCAARGGQIIVIGEEPEFPEIDTIQIAQRELEIIGSRNGSRQDALDALDWIAKGVISPPIVERIPLERINEGLQMVRDGSAHGRVIVTLDDAS